MDVRDTARHELADPRAVLSVYPTQLFEVLMGFLMFATSLSTFISAVLTLVAWYSAGRKLLLQRAGPTTIFGLGRRTT